MNKTTDNIASFVEYVKKHQGMKVEESNLILVIVNQKSPCFPRCRTTEADYLRGEEVNNLCTSRELYTPINLRMTGISKDSPFSNLRISSSETPAVAAISDRVNRCNTRSIKHLNATPTFECSIVCGIVCGWNLAVAVPFPARSYFIHIDFW